MTLIANPLNHHAVKAGWADAMTQLAWLLQSKNVHPSRAVVLLPYAQLMQEARAAWADHAQSQGKQSAFVPRFETTMNWAGSTPGCAAAAQDIQMDVALDVLGALQASGRKVGIITHVPGLEARFAAQVRVKRNGAGSSSVEVGF